MKNLTVKNLLTNNSRKNKLLTTPKKAIVKQMIRYIYTEQDLGEDILHVGVTAALYASMK